MSMSYLPIEKSRFCRFFSLQQHFRRRMLACLPGWRSWIMRRELAEIRTGMHRNIEQTALMIKFINIYLVPLLIAAALGLAGLREFLASSPRRYKSFSDFF